MRQNSFRIFDLEGQPIDLELKDISNIVIREDKGVVRYAFKYLETDIGQTEALADAWAIFLEEGSKK